MADLTATVKPSGKAVPNGIPDSAKGTIKQLETAAIDGTTAGADDLAQNAATAPGSNRSIPEPYRKAIVTNADVHVP